MHEQSSFYEDELGKIWMENGVIHYVNKKNVVIHLEAQIKHTEFRNSISGNCPRAMMVDARGVKYWTGEAKKYSNSEAGTRLVAAVALIIDFSLQKTLWNWAVAILRIKTPSR